MKVSIHQKIQKAAMRVAKSWPTYPNGRPAVVNGHTIESAILTRMGFGRETGLTPIISDRLQATLKAAGEGAVKTVWSV